MVRFVPGWEQKRFEILRKTTATDAKGRVNYSASPSRIGQFFGMLANASQKEQEQWKQMGHPITHTISLKNSSGAKPEDILMTSGRKFYVQSINPVAEVGLYEVIYCEERMGV